MSLATMDRFRRANAARDASLVTRHPPTQASSTALPRENAAPAFSAARAHACKQTPPGVTNDTVNFQELLISEHAKDCAGCGLQFSCGERRGAGGLATRRDFLS
eukprot:CAMPEP_0182861948 /NCGR_PEP_ID=MMETSP0034_2-20130328/5784_1 /TAXON_ID=156128 /ORGANISM="Nephroselmis pyriformis, Strain CCMP717" /LENGTH=103 /DNA_ID=CAMNT_0024993943 /DNA_START=97 /DNA_END=408 /DNA_ORIENTATION=+